MITRQGDVMLLPTTPVVGPIINTAGLHITGDRTGNPHRLPGIVYRIGADIVVRVQVPSMLTHAEHRHLLIPAGWYLVRQQIEWVPQRGISRRWD